MLGRSSNNMVLGFLLITTLTILIWLIAKAIKKHFFPLLIFFAMIILIWFIIPFEYINGWIQYKLDIRERNYIINDLNSGKYDSIIAKNSRRKYPTWIVNDNMRFKLFKDTSLQMIFIWQGNIRTFEGDYCGSLYISDTSKNTDERVNDFIQKDIHKKYLGDNWYWIDYYEDIQPFK
jgi:hypothetical protein